MTKNFLSSRLSALAAVLAQLSLLLLVAGCASDESAEGGSDDIVLSFSAQTWSADAVVKGCSMSGVQAKRLESKDPSCESFDAGGVRIDCEKKDGGRVDVRLRADNPEGKRLMAGLANNIASASLPKDRVRRIKAKVRH
jgi:hypothetical protein